MLKISKISSLIYTFLFGWFDKKIMLIDFQWATKINDPIPNNWPDCIGGQYKHKNKFDDSYSIYKSIQSII